MTSFNFLRTSWLPEELAEVPKQGKGDCSFNNEARSFDNAPGNRKVSSSIDDEDSAHFIVSHEKVESDSTGFSGGTSDCCSRGVNNSFECSAK